MSKIYFLFGVHNHQPVGNFDNVFREGMSQCYLPFLECLERHPRFRIALHYSGPLLEWIEKNRPQILRRIHKLVWRKQVEMLGGGFYEPLLASIPEADAIGQMKMLTKYIQKNFGYDPSGFWLAERIWDTSLPKRISKTGMKYTLTDDTHFYYAGLDAEDMFGYYMTEKDGFPLAIFPIRKELRYLIPFRKVEETLKFFRELMERFGTVAVTYGDDGEKFGIWPGTYGWVYKKGWLDRFMTCLDENSDWIEMLTFSEYMDSFPPRGRIYLPNTSYHEMMEWALPTKAAIRFKDMLVDLADQGKRDVYRPFIRGGLWDNFMVKYPESNMMHKKMLYVSKKVRNLPRARREMWKGQCNCAYWHGVFGGLYLNHLRHAVYEHLIRAEQMAEQKSHKGKDKWLTYEIIDFDKDGRQEVLVSNSIMNAYFSPAYGGTLFELDFKPRAFNLADTLTRREEVYHHKFREQVKVSNVNTRVPREIKSIHEISEHKKLDLKKGLFYDWYERRSFIDHILGEETTFEQFKRCNYPEWGDFVNQPYAIESIQFKKNSGTISLKRDGGMWRNGVKIPINVKKTFQFSTNSWIKVTYDLKSQAKLKTMLWFGVEFNLTLLSKEDPMRYYAIPEQGVKHILGKEGQFENITSFQLVDKWDKINMDFHFSPVPCLWYFPLETISQSEEGFKFIYQGSVILFHWKMELKAAETSGIDMTLKLGTM
ncbi:MAG TPA: DUF1926 domain-containing protein [Syntrophaceae bacterium]|nr:DUF1926 domain-containing protein [Syntrophaceae bacterium]